MLKSLKRIIGEVLRNVHDCSDIGFDGGEIGTERRLREIEGCAFSAVWVLLWRFGSFGAATPRLGFIYAVLFLALYFIFYFHGPTFII